MRPDADLTYLAPECAPSTASSARATLDRLDFAPDGTIRPVVPTLEGIKPTRN
ncbi:hypothetical protein [Streptomyces chartreusis]|uniref:hypothetical protein n=1 Tax=Streptomyces chartreusis TaxID=1969 RepID=UPI00365946A2